MKNRKYSALRALTAALVMMICAAALAATAVDHIVDLGEVAREAALEHGVAAEAESAEVLGDPDRLLQLLRNLVANAVRAAGKEGVRVRVRREADHALLEVEDSGPGIPEDLLPRLGHPSAARQALQQSHPDQLLELAELEAHRGRRD